MGCFASKSSTGNSAGPHKSANAATGKDAQSAKKTYPTYVTADPDLGWRSVTDPTAAPYYPLHGLLLDFQNERSGNVLKTLDLGTLAINIAERAGKLADRYGLVQEAGQSSTNLLQDIAKMHQDQQEEENQWNLSIDADMRRLLKAVGCPKYGWKLKTRATPSAPLIKNCPDIFLLAEDGQARTALSELASIPDYLQLLQDSEGKECLMNVGEIGMNIAEQLFRLEKSEAIGHKVPKDTFGWKVIRNGDNLSGGSASGYDRESAFIPVANPEGEAFMMIPEELIMNVASWVQQTYLTAPAF